MRIAIKIFIGLFFISGFGVNANAASDAAEKQQLCKEEDLTGTYKLVDLEEKPKGKEALAYQKIHYHYLAFYRGHYYSYLASDHEILTAAEVVKSLAWPQNEHHVLTYKLDNQGVLNLFTDSTIDYSYRCLSIKQGQGSWVKGDLVLTGYTRDKTQLYKLYRRWF